MPLVSATISELTEHVFFPILQQLSHRVLRALGYHDQIADRIYINTDWSTHSKTSDINQNAFVGQEMFKVEALLQMNPSQQKFDCYTFHHTTAYGISRTTTMSGTAPVYYDKENRVKIVEMRSPCTIVMNCELTLKSADLAFQAPQRIFNGYENGAIFHFNDLVFDYPIPPSISTVLYGLWQMDRIKGKPAGVPFLAYLQRHTGGQWQLHTHRSRPEHEIVVPSTNLQTLATLEYSDDKPNAVMKDRLPIGFTIPFVYTVQFALPTLDILEFQPVYNNQLVPGEYIPRDLHQRFNEIPEMHHGRADQLYDEDYRYRPPGYMILPEYDDWRIMDGVQTHLTHYYPILQAAVLVDEANIVDGRYRTVLDFDNDFKGEDGELSDLMKEFLYQQGEESVTPSVPVTVALFKDDKQLVPKEDYWMDRDLKLYFDTDSLQSHYHCVVAVSIDLSRVHYSWYPLLKKYFPLLPKALHTQVMNAVLNGSWKDPDLPARIQMAHNGWIYDEFNRPIRHITETKYPFELTRSRHAFCEPYRILTTTVLPRTAESTLTGNAKQTSRSR